MMGVYGMICNGKIHQCLNCKRPKCVYDGGEVMTDAYHTRERIAKQKYYYAHREQILAKQREYDRAHKRSHRRRENNEDGTTD